MDQVEHEDEEFEIVGDEEEIVEPTRKSPYIPPNAVTLDVLFKESGFGFLIGSATGLAYHPLYYGPGSGFGKSGSGSGFIPRLRYGVTKAPLTGAKFAYWFGLRAFVEHTTAAIRCRADPLNSFVSGVVVGVLAARRRGLVAASAASLVLGSCFALFDAACDRYYYQEQET